MYAQKDTASLYMDIYRQKNTPDQKQPVMFFIFGGSFKRGNRDAPVYNDYFYTLASSGITVISIDYRLGLAGKKIRLFNTKPADEAINMAVEDLFSATNYVIEHAGVLGVDPGCIMISGSSAGAVTSLQADYYISNKMPLSRMLPEGFTYKGVLAFAGAIFSHKGTPDYQDIPAPTLFMHGNKDRIVFYNRLRFFRKGLFGSKSIAGRFKKRDYSYFFLTFEGADHRIAVTPMSRQLDTILWFIDTYIYNARQMQIDSFFRELE
ncbi:MAG: carboxylesterase family protein [Bacteroides sp.]|nr:carboxylesterase family protein [Bacteroides sp.]